MDLSAFEPMLSFQDELLRTLPSATAPVPLRAAPDTKPAPVPGANLVEPIGKQAFALRAQAEQALTDIAAQDQQEMTQILDAATAPLPPVDMAVVSQLLGTGGQPAPTITDTTAPPPPPPPPQPKKRGRRPPKA